MVGSHWKSVLVASAACIAMATSVGAHDFGNAAFDRGYREGVQQGQHDAREGRTYRVENSRVYRDADAGYNRRDGNRDAYRDEFRRGFSSGYHDGYERVGVRTNGQVWRNDRGDNDDRWGRNDRGPGGRRGYQEPAYARGYSDGWQQGAEDFRDRDRYDPSRHGEYKSADHGYERNYGSKDSYKNNYRSGFRQGYEDGYRNGNRTARR